MECILFEKRFCLKPKYKHFVYSLVAYGAFFLAFAVRISLLLLLFFFFSRGARGHAVVMVNDPFSDFQFFGSEESV